VYILLVTESNKLAVQVVAFTFGEEVGLETEKLWRVMIMWQNLLLVAMVDMISRSFGFSFVHTQGLECFLLCGGFRG
jgi:hypothetical protein